MTHVDAQALAEIEESVAELARRGGISPERVFVAWYAINFFDIEEDAALEAAALDGASDRGIDFLYTDHVNERVVILQGHWPQNRAKAAPKSKIDSLASLPPFLDNPDSFLKEGRSDIAAAAQEAYEKRDKYELLLGLISCGTRSEQIAATVEQLNASERIAPYRLFYEAAKDTISRYTALNDDNVGSDTVSFTGGYFEDVGEYGKAYVGSVTATELQRLYEKHKDQLFARNVRMFLGTRKGGINEQIVTTAKTAPGRFWALNNGITIVADTVKPVQGHPGSFSLTRFSIVNGCQTTMSLHKAGAPADARVLTRLVAANQAVLNDIVMYNNTQNAVRIWTVRAGVSPISSPRRILTKSRWTDPTTSSSPAWASLR